MSSNILLTRICEHCGKPFKARTTVTRYCPEPSPCGKRGYKARLKTKKIESSDKQVAEILEKPFTKLRAKDYLNIAETCLLLGVSRMTLHRQIKSGRLKAKRFGKRVIISKKHIEDLFK